MKLPGLPSEARVVSFPVSTPGFFPACCTTCHAGKKKLGVETGNKTKARIGGPIVKEEDAVSTVLIQECIKIVKIFFF